MDDSWGEAQWTAPRLWLEEHPDAFLPVLWHPPPKPKTVPIWRVAACTVLIQVLACTAGILAYLTFFAEIAG